MISIRSDIVGVFDGDIRINNCDFIGGKQNVSYMIVLNESITTRKPTNSAVQAPGKRSRIINGCRIPESCKYVIKTGDSISDEQYLFDNITYAIKETTVSQNTTPLYSIGGTATATQETEYRYKVTHS